MKQHILITNVYSYLNKGDAAIVISLIREINRVFNADIKIQTTDIINDVDKYNAPVSPTLLWLLLSSVRTSNILTQCTTLIGGSLLLITYLFLYRLSIKAPFILTPALRRYVGEIEKSDFVIACGGGYLRTADSSPRNLVLLFVTCLNFLSAWSMRKKVYLYSQSVGPVYGKLQRALLRFTLNRVTIIEPREAVSVAYLQELSPKSLIEETADAVLLLGDYGHYSKQLPGSQSASLRVGITVRKWFKDEEKFHDYLKSVANAVDYLVSNYNAEVYYVPQVIAKNFGDDDRTTALLLQSMIEHQSEFHLIEDDLTVEEIIGLCGSMDIFIGTRMHSNIFALINTVPVIAIEYEPKTRGIMLGLGLEKMIIDINEITFSLLQEKIDDLISHREGYSRLIKQNMPEQARFSRRAIEVIKDNYEK